MQRTPVQLYVSSQSIKHKEKKRRSTKPSTITQLAVAKQQVNDVPTRTQNGSYEYYHDDDDLIQGKDDDVTNSNYSVVEEIGCEKGNKDFLENRYPKMCTPQLSQCCRNHIKCVMFDASSADTRSPSEFLTR